MKRIDTHQTRNVSFKGNQAAMGGVLTTSGSTILPGGLACDYLARERLSRRVEIWKLQVMAY
jgi:hypothetical protein